MATVTLNPPIDRRLRFNVQYKAGFTPKDIEKHQASYALGGIVINTVEFKERTLKKKFRETDGFENLQIYQKIMDGAEVLQPTPDYEVDVQVEMYEENTSTVGWTKPSVIWTKLNRKFFKKFNYAEVFGNLFHEWLHKLGFGHPKDRTSWRDETVVYALGYLVRDMINELIKGAVFTDIWTGEKVDVNWKTPAPGTTPVESPTRIPPKPTTKVVCKRVWYTLWTKKVCYRVSA